jgi:hypothetical protein
MGRTSRGSPPPTVMRRTLAITALAGALALLPSSAWGSGNDVIRDCTDNGRIDNQHGPRDYQEALANLPSDVDEYTDCRQIIQAARLGDQGGGGGGGGGGGQGGGGGGGGGGPGGGSSAQAARRTMPVVKGAPITPPASRLASHPVPERIPTSVIILLAVLGVALLGGLLAAATGFKAPMSVVRIVDRVFPGRA